MCRGRDPRHELRSRHDHHDDLPVAPTAAALAVAPAPSRAGLYALVAGAALNTAQAVLMRSFSSGDSPAARLADGDAQPGMVLAMILTGLAGVVLLLSASSTPPASSGRTPPHRARRRRADLRRTLGFLGVHALMLVTVRPRRDGGPAAALAVLEHLETAPVLLVLFAPFLLGMFGGVAALTVGLFRSAGVPRWVPACWALFLPLDLLAAGASPVDPHWLFLAGAVGIALAGRAGCREALTASRARP
jgi:hypothetical protein